MENNPERNALDLLAFLLAFSLSFQLAGAAWVNPASVTGTDWNNRNASIDGSDSTYAYYNIPPGPASSTQLELNCNNTVADKVRVYLNINAKMIVSVDVYYDNGWHELSDQFMTSPALHEIEIGKTAVIEKARIQIGNRNDSTQQARVYYFQLNETTLPEPTPTPTPTPTPIPTITPTTTPTPTPTTTPIPTITPTTTPTPTPTTTPIPTTTPTTTPTPTPSDSNETTKKPEVSTLEPISVMVGSAIIRGKLDNTGGKDCFVWFEWGLTEEYGKSTKKRKISKAGEFEQYLSKLSPYTVYHYRAIAENSEGKTEAGDFEFKTPKCSIMTTATNLEKWHTAPFEIAFGCTAVNTECKKTSYRLNDGKWADGNLIKIEKDGNYKIFYFSEGTNGLKEETNKSWAGLDRNAPELSKKISVNQQENSILIEWNEATDKVSGVKEYLVFRDGKKIADTNALKYSDSGVETGKTYSYAISALDFAGNESSKSDEIKAVIQEEKSRGKKTPSPTAAQPSPLAPWSDYSAYLLPATFFFAAIVLALVFFRKKGNAPKRRQKKKGKKKPQGKQKELAVREELMKLKERLGFFDNTIAMPKKEEKRKLDRLIERLKEDLRRLRK